jgi:hypothetical protein
MHQLAGILLEMQALDADGGGLAVGQLDRDLALADDRRLVLADLVALRQVRIEVVLAVEGRAPVDLRFQAEPGTDRLLHAFLVDDRQHARHGRIDQRDMAVRRSAELRGRAGEQLGVRIDLGVDFQTDDHFPVAGGALDELRRFDRCVHGAVSTATRGAGKPLLARSRSIATARPGRSFERQRATAMT